MYLRDFGLRRLALGLSLAAGFTSATPAALAQYRTPYPGIDTFSTPSATVRGQISADETAGLGSLTVEIRGSNGMNQSAFVGSDGSFSLDNVPSGNYELSVTARNGTVIRRDIVSLPTPILSIRLEVAHPERPASGTISLARLRHKVPNKAVKEYRRAEKESKKGHIDKAILHLRKAVEIDPEYMEAYNTLGVRYTDKQDYESALNAFDQAAKLDSGSALAASNCAAALFALKRLPEAALAARRALGLDPTLTRAHYVLGLSLALTNGSPEETLHHLSAAADQFPNARLAQAEVLVRTGQTKRARQELENYLALGDQRQRTKVRSWLKSLPKQ